MFSIITKSKRTGVRAFFICAVACCLLFTRGVLSRASITLSAVRLDTDGPHDRGRLFMPPKKVKPFRDSEDRFWSQVDKSGNCWLWLGLKSKKRYGRFFHDGFRWQAHRFAYAITYGECPSHLFVCHKCDNPSCVNPDHLFLGTHTDNEADKQSKGRVPKGENAGRAKITTEDVIRIAALYKSGTPITDIAAQYSIARQTVSDILKGKSWKHVEDARVPVTRRGPRGEASGSARLTEADVAAIRSAYVCGCSLKDIAQRHNVSINCIRDIIKQRTWRHL